MGVIYKCFYVKKCSNILCRNIYLLYTVEDRLQSKYRNNFPLANGNMHTDNLFEFLGLKH